MEEVPGSNPGGPIIFRRKSEGRKANPRGEGNKDRQGKVGGGQCGCAQAHNSIGPGGDSAKRRGGCDGRNPGPTTFLTRFAEELRRAIAGEIIFRRKSEGRKANPRGAGNEDRQGKVRGVKIFWMFDYLFLIREKIAHAKVAKVANPTTLLTRFAEELRRAPVAGGWF